MKKFMAVMIMFSFLLVVIAKPLKPKDPKKPEPLSASDLSIQIRESLQDLFESFFNPGS